MWDHVATRLKEPFRRRSSKRGRKQGDDNGRDTFRFLSLPPEIRLEIYLLVFGREGVHLLYEEDRITHLRCTKPNPSPIAELCCPHIRSIRSVLYERREAQKFAQEAELPQDDNTRGLSRVRSSLRRRRAPSQQQHRDRFRYQRDLADRHWFHGDIAAIPMALVRVNRQISSEALAALYSTLTFQVDSLEAFFRFAILISSDAIASIRRLRASWLALACLTQAPVPPDHHDYPRYEYYTALSDDSYRAFWRIVAKNMRGLVDMSFVMDYSGQYLSRALDAEWHQPLRKVRGLRNLQLQIWDKNTGTEDAEVDMEALRDYLTSTMCQVR